MPEVKQGDRVQVHYTGTLEDQTEFDSSAGGDPLEFTIGEGHILPGFEEAVVGLSPGEKVETQIPSDEAYGERREDLLLEVKRSDLASDLDPDVGDRLKLRTGEGQEVAVSVAGKDEETLTLDANHPLAGKDLRFEIELVAIL